MSVEIYYFTSTGNSLVIAREIAARTDGELISIASTRDQDRVRTDAEAIGLVFPVYYASLGGSGLPRIVEQFARRLEALAHKYLFAVCTHSGGPVDTIENLDRILRARGGELAVGFGVQTGIPYPASAKIGHLLFHRELHLDRRADDVKRRALFAACAPRLDLLHRQIQARVRGEVAVRSAAAKIAGRPWLWIQKQMAVARYQMLSNSTSRSLQELIPRADASFQVGETCNGCGVCARICPVGNIHMLDGRPVWQGHCETCYACFQWCAKKAVRGLIVEYEKRDHHPQVKLAAMLRQVSQADPAVAQG